MRSEEQGRGVLQRLPVQGTEDVIKSLDLDFSLIPHQLGEGHVTKSKCPKEVANPQGALE